MSLPQTSEARITQLYGAPAFESEDDDGGRRLETDLLEYWRKALKHRWTILASVLVALAIGAAVTLLTQPLYTAQSTLQIDRESAKVVSGQDETPSDQLVAGEEFFQTQYGLLRSRSLAERVIDSLGLAHNDDFIKAMGAKPPVAAADTDQGQRQRREEILKLLQTHLAVVPTRGSRLVSVGFTSPDAALSARVANAFAENFIASNLDRRFESSSYARDFLERHLAQVKSKLEDQERELVAYAASQHIIELSDNSQPNNPGAQQSLQAEDLQSINTALAAATADRIQKQQRWEQARLTPGLGLTEILQSPTIQELSQEKAKLSAQYQDNLSIYKPDYPDMRQLQARITELDKQINQEAGSIRRSLQSQYAAAQANENALSGRVEGLKGSVLDLRNRSIQYNILQREVDTSRTLYDGLLQRYKEVGIAGGITTNNISIVDRADPPLRPSSPKRLANMLGAGVMGLVIGFLIAFIMEALDQAVRVPADAEAKLGLPVLGSVPILAKGLQPREALADNKSPLAEAYFSLRSALQFSTKDGFPKTLLVTSTRPSEGKSTTAYALAHNVARPGFRTLLIDADLRNPSLHKVLGADNRSGLSNILTGAATVQDVVQPGSLPHLSIITSGPLPPSPAELLSGGRLRAFINEAAQQFDMVIIDGPPVLGLADAPLISAVVAGTLLVIEAGKTARAPARAAIRRLQMARAHILGVVLTKFNARDASYGYGYAYEYEYAYGAAKQAASETSLSKLRKQARRLISSK